MTLARLLSQLRFVHQLSKAMPPTEGRSAPDLAGPLAELEADLGLPLVERDGARPVGLTREGRTLLPTLEKLILEVDNLLRQADDLSQADAGQLVVATTHLQARYVLPEVVRDFRRHYPRVRLALHQTTPDQIADMVATGAADIGLATEGLARHPALVSVPSRRWGHCVLVPREHPLAGMGSLSLEALATHPIVTYDPAFAGRSRIDVAFTAAGLTPNIVLTAIDADVIKKYVETGLGVGIVAEMAWDPERDTHLAALSTRHLFGPNLSRIAVRRGGHLRPYAEAFVRAAVAPEFQEELNRSLPRRSAPAAAPA